MVFKVMIFKVIFNIVDMDWYYYVDYYLIIVQYFLEIDEWMMIWLLVFVFNVNEYLEFIKGLSIDDELELWQKSLSDEIELWIELGLLEEGWLWKVCNWVCQVIFYIYGGCVVFLWWDKYYYKLS